MTPQGALAFRSSDEEAINIGQFIPPPGGALFFGQGGSLVDLNHTLSCGFCNSFNGETAAEYARIHSSPAQQFLTMVELPEGQALDRILTSGTPVVHFRGVNYRTDTWFGKADLLDSAADVWATETEGIATVAATDTFPDTVFRRREHRCLMENSRVLQIRSIRKSINRDVISVVDSESGERVCIERCKFESAGSGRFLEPQIVRRLTERIFEKEAWNQYQRDQWLLNIAQLLDAQFGPRTNEPLADVPGQIVYTRHNSCGRIVSQFLCELQMILQEVQRLQSLASNCPLSAKALEGELARISRCKELVSRYPKIRMPIQNSEAIADLAKFLLNMSGLPIAEKLALWGDSDNSQSRIEFSLSGAKRLLEQLDLFAT